MFKNFDLPKELTEFSDSIEDVNILVGENGSGKSIMLNEVARYHTNAGRNVIAIANSIYDKFNVRKSNFKILRGGYGKQLAKRSIIDLLKVFADDYGDNKYSVLRTLDYIGFDQVLGLKINPRKINQLKNHRDSNDQESINSFFAYFYDIMDSNKVHSKNDFVPINLDRNNLQGQLSWDLFRLLRHSKLNQQEVLRIFDFALMKNNQLIELFGASSGELTLLTSLIFISANIDKETIILIDEPENSLHPKWQIEFIRLILDLFHLYQPKIIIATHSPLIINGGKLNVQNINILKGGPNGFFPLERNKKNVEEIYEEYFNVTTPENRYLSDFLMSKFNLLTERKMELSDFENVVNRFIDQSYDEVQQKALRGIIKLAHQVESNN
ncbi:AAA family ATPase [Sphingobacterium faecale]|uniref:ATP-binding protein n=1 Tax=Sphingobacterium faecale TaxID=2803775 RepID=A0ABS1RAP1_9SPHI|nr:AAA family ATPase [Sphingobacterium faecale]MBL1411097.1 ATP-binding protein [Sphingobacterium faecale]